MESDHDGLASLTLGTDWFGRVQETAHAFVPFITSKGPELLAHVESSLNSPATVRRLWAEIKPALKAELLATKLDSALARETRLLSVITGDTISKLIADFLCGAYSDLRQNDRSTYPDLYFVTRDYSMLPRRARGQAIGPAIRGTRPTSVPDGVEIKSNNGARIRVDCHHPHQGLHLALTYTNEAGVWKVLGLYLAYLAKSDYKRAHRNTTATTEKFSFGHTTFISVFE